MIEGPIQRNSPTRPSRVQRVVARVLLLMVVALLVVDPLWECHDHLDNLRHMGPSGILVIALLFACAGIMLFRSLCWSHLGGLRTLPFDPQLFSAPLPHACSAAPSIVSADLLLPLRI